jgi:hypothetical protein
MGIVLVLRPYGLLGKAAGDGARDRRGRAAAAAAAPLGGGRLAGAVPRRALLGDRYVTVLATDIACFALFAVSLHFIMGPAGMVSFGHAAYFGLGAYAGALLFKKAGLPMELALVLRTLRRRPVRRGLRLVLRAAVGRLSRHADPGFRADQLVDRLPVGRADRRQQRPGRRLAGAWLADKTGLLLS